MKLKPYALLLGGNHPQAILELHDLRFTLAQNREAAFRSVADAWFGDVTTAHVDAWTDLTFVDGHVFTSEVEAEPGKKLFFINIGSYLPGVFSEDHHYFFLIGTSIQQIKTRAKKLMRAKRELVHVDLAAAIDEIIPVESVNGQKIYWKAAKRTASPQVHTGYWPLKAYRKA